MKITLSVDEEIVRRVRQHAERLGTSVNQLMRDYLAQLAGQSKAEEDAAEFERLSRLSGGHSKGWKFDRNELHERQ